MYFQRHLYDTFKELIYVRFVMGTLKQRAEPGGAQTHGAELVWKLLYKQQEQQDFLF